MISSWILLSYKYNRDKKNYCFLVQKSVTEIIVRGCGDWNYKVINIVKKLIINNFMSGLPPFSSCRKASIYIPITKYWSKPFQCFTRLKTSHYYLYTTVRYNIVFWAATSGISRTRYWAIIMVVYFASFVVAEFEHLHMACLAEEFRGRISSLPLSWLFIFTIIKN